MTYAVAARPAKNEYAEYYETYVSVVEETDIVSALENQLAEIENLFAGIPEEKGAYAYADGKWTIKQLAGHLIDGERIFAYRALRIARADRTPLPGFEQDGYIAHGDFDNRTLADLIEEFTLLRKANNILFKNLPADAWSRTGTASDAEVSVLALAYIMVGHVRHHLNILKNRYLAQ
jgi:hypothetical protein